MQALLVGLISVIAGLGAGYLLRHVLGGRWAESKEVRAEQALQEAKREADAARKDAQIQAKAEAIKLRENFEKSTQGRRRELGELEARIAEREGNLDRKLAMIDKKDRALEEKLAEAAKRTADLAAAQEKAAKLEAEQRDRLQVIAGMTRDQAKEALLGRVEKEVQSDIGSLIRRRQEEAKETAEREAKKIVALAIERFAVSHASEMMTSTVALPNDDMKGRIIGRDGRNIRSLEAVTGVNILIDDTPEAVVISGFDPVRREIARVALEQLVADGRIHPARIEEVVAKARENMEETIRSAGQEAAHVAGVQNVEPELIRMLGRLKFRTSFAQNVLQHSIEVSHLMGVMAGELGLDSNLAKRIGLFHDIGKALDHEVEGGHAVIGADLLKRQNESAVMINAVAAHHEEVEPESAYALLAAAADAISSSRVGARSETTDIYVKRLEKLENISNGFAGVEKSYAIQAGREVRVIVQPEKVDDNGAMAIARGISQKIESDLQYPGQIRVMVIRETRCVEYAR